MAFNILIVDDESDIRELVSGILEDNGYSTTTAGSYVEADNAIKEIRPNLVILDVWLGESDRDGLRLLDVIKSSYEFVPVIMMSGHGTIETAVSAIKQGAYDFIEKPFDSARLMTSIEKAIDAAKLLMENAELKVKAKVSDGILGQSQHIQNIRKQVEKIAPLNGRCVIIGPTGADKETIAKEIHSMSPRHRSPFRAINCRSYSPRQLESELFGMEVSTLEGTSVTSGILEKVNGGTLFIDELDYTSLEFQQKILRLLKEDGFYRIGSNKKIHIDIRLIAGLPTDIDTLIKNGEFSDELYCRMNANMVKVLPLRARREDITYLLQYFMEKAAKAHNTTPKRFSNEAIGVLNAYPWPGDVAQMRNMIDWILTVTNSEGVEKAVIELADLPREIVDGKTDTTANTQFISSVSELSIREAREAFEREYFIEQLKKFGGNVSRTAKFVGMERSALHRKLKTLDICDSRSFKIIEED